jgi:hypothetical protein
MNGAPEKVACELGVELAMAKDDSWSKVAVITSILSLFLAGYAIYESTDLTKKTSRARLDLSTDQTEGFGEILTIKVGGSTEALNVNLDIGCTFNIDSGNGWKEEIPLTSRLHDQVLLPATTNTFICRPNGPVEQATGRATHSRVFKGTLTYVDVYGDNHGRTFCLYQPHFTTSQFLELCPEGNSSY